MTRSCKINVSKFQEQNMPMQNLVGNQIYRSFDIWNPVGHVINFVAINDAYYTAAAFCGKVGTSNRK